MRERSEALHGELERDPLVLYYTAYGRSLTAEEARDAMPWNAIEVVTDSLVSVVTPGNLREADRAYYNYAVLRMRAVRGDPDVPCEEVFGREVEAVDAFIEGWIVARTLFGGPPYPPLDELVFARADGVLPGLIAARGDRQIGGCLAVWVDGHPGETAEYDRWRTRQTEGDG